MKILIITVAGIASRFSESVGYPSLKCLYTENGIEETLLYRILNHNRQFDYYVIVGGFMYEELEAAIKENFNEFGDRLLLVKNEHYADLGSGYSLYLAFKKILDMDIDFDEIVFAEGDLYVDSESFMKVCKNTKDVITCNTEAILSEKAVAFYFDIDYKIHYIYDTKHSTLEIREPFRGIFNSGQIWKFADAKHLKRVIYSMDETDWEGTNLVLIQNYFGSLAMGEYDVVTFKEWVNCNTISDYNKCGMKGGIRNEDVG